MLKKVLILTLCYICLLQAHATSQDSLVRLILYGGAREKNAADLPHKVGIQHNNTFGNAAFRLKKEYLAYTPKHIKIKVVKVETGAEIVHILNKQKTNTILSLDIISHDDMPSVNMSYQENTNCGIYTNKNGKFFVEKIHKKGYHFVAESRSLDDIDYSRFADSAKVEFHGCRTAGIEWICWNISHYFSWKLAEAGKPHAFVVGHFGKSETLIFRNGDNIADYRHKWRIVYQNGKMVKRTRKKGDIFATLIH